MDREEYNLDLMIDPMELDVEAVRQADVFFKWAERSIDAKAAADLAESNMDALEARLQTDCRKNPKKFGLENVTETGVKSAVRASDAFMVAVNTMLVKKKEAALLAEAVKALDHKKRMLEILTTLHGQQYFASPTNKSGLAERYMARNDRTHKAANERQVKAARKRGRVDDDD